MPGALLRPGSRRARPRPRQYAALRYWAGCTTDTARTYTSTRGPAPHIHPSTLRVILDREWGWLTPAREGFHALIVTDTGRTAAGMPPAWRDRICPVCHARRGERCIAEARYVTETHAERAVTPPTPRDTDVSTTQELVGYDPDALIGYVQAT